MRITLTGSLGHIGQPLTENLVRQGHTVTVVSSNPARVEQIEALGTTPAIGSVRDVDFLTEAFAGADVVYTMVPPANYFDHGLDLLGYYQTLGKAYAEAIAAAGTRRVVNLSSIGAHLSEGNGILQGTYHVEQLLNALPQNVSVTHVRPVEFYYNLYGFSAGIKANGAIASNVGPDDTNVWVSPTDIAATAAGEIAGGSGGRNVVYVASEELTYREVASTLGRAIGKPDLAWVKISDEEMAQGLAGVGMQPASAEGMTEMYAAIRTGLLYEDHRRHEPSQLGQVKMDDFAREFASAYEAQP